MHGGAHGFTPLVCTKRDNLGAHGFTPLVCTKRDNLIEIDPHVTGQCVLVLNEKAASELFDALREWLG
jgi:hypothetical protein